MHAMAHDVLNGTVDWSVEVGDSREWVYSLPPNSVHCCITSPPYFSLRAYLPDDHPDKDKEMGTERTPDRYVANLVDVFRGVRRALHDRGCLFLNLGDSYSSGGRNSYGPIIDGTKQATQSAVKNATRPAQPMGIKPKELLGIPWLVAFALRADGWYLRQWMPWCKRSAMPDSADDRPGAACETVFLLTKSEQYYFDMEAVKVRAATAPHAPAKNKWDASRRDANRSDEIWAGDGMRNFRNGDLWFDSVGMLLAGHLDGSDDDTILGIDATADGTKEKHFAVMAKRLILPLVLAGTSERGVCPYCSAPWVRVTEKERVTTRPGTNTKLVGRKDPVPGQSPNSNVLAHLNSATVGNRDPERHVTKTHTVGWEPSCKCANNDPVPAVVIDPFIGSGNVLCVARDRGRVGCGNDLNADYVNMARRRIGNVIPGIF